MKQIAIFITLLPLLTIAQTPAYKTSSYLVEGNKDIEHWHSSTKESNVTYLALYGGTQPTTWTEKLSQEYYDSVAKKLGGK